MVCVDLRGRACVTAGRVWSVRSEADRSPAARRPLCRLLSALLLGAVLASFSASPSPLGMMRVAASSVFVGSAGFTVDQPLSVQGTDIGAALLSLQSQLTAQATELQSQRVEISELRANLTITNALVASQAATIAALSSLSGDSALVKMVVATNLSSSAIGDLTGPSTIVATVLSLMDSMTDLATEIATVQTLAEENSQLITELTETLSAQVTLINTEISTVETELEAEIEELQKWNVTVNQRIDDLQARATDDETSIATNAADITTLQSRATDDEVTIALLGSWNRTAIALITALQSRATDDEMSITALQVRATNDEANITSLLSRRALTASSYYNAVPENNMAAWAWGINASFPSIVTPCAGVVTLFAGCNLARAGTQPSVFRNYVSITSSSGAVSEMWDQTLNVMFDSTSLRVGAGETIRFNATYQNKYVTDSSSVYCQVGCSATYAFIPD